MDLSKDPVSDENEFINRLEATFCADRLAEKFSGALLREDVVQQSELKAQMNKICARREHYLSLYRNAKTRKDIENVVSSVSIDYEPTTEEMSKMSSGGV